MCIVYLYIYYTYIISKGHTKHIRIRQMCMMTDVYIEQFGQKDTASLLVCEGPIDM